MKLLSFEGGYGLLQDHQVVILGDGDLGQALTKGPPYAWEGDLTGRQRQSLDGLRLLAPIPRPPKVVAVGLNYSGHAGEQGKEAPAFPTLFAKARTCIIGPGEPIRLPPGRPQIDVEVELAVVIGRPGRDLAPEQALQHVLGFTILNDVSDREAQKSDRQFYRAKSWHTFGPTGPWVVTPDEFDHRAAPLRLWRSGFLQQEACISQLVHKVEKLISILSHIQELEPGDLLATGTPSGVGAYRDPPVFLRPGDLIECEIEGIGRLRNPVVGDD